MRRARKQREAPPPGRWIRSPSGTVARLVRTAKVSPADEWLFRLWYPSDHVKGNALWAWSDLAALGCEFFDQGPA